MTVMQVSNKLVSDVQTYLMVGEILLYTPPIYFKIDYTL